MAATQSNMLELGTKITNFELFYPKLNKFVKYEDYISDIATVVMFLCNHCPFVKHINEKLVELSNYYISKGISFIAINSNDVENYPEDSPEKMIEYSEKLGYKFPYLFDETQEIAKLFKAACTPDFYIFDSDLKLVYRGQFDDSRPGNGIQVTGKDIIDALESILRNEKINENQKPSIGCNIKWKRG